MTYRYIIKWRKHPTESISVEAWSKDIKATRKPSFTIGRLSGTRNIMLWTTIEDMSKKYGITKNRNTLKIEPPVDDIDAIAETYRLGLSAAALGIIDSEEGAINAVNYISKATKEEIWFWASKYLAVVDEGIKTHKVIEALSILST